MSVAKMVRESGLVIVELMGVLMGMLVEHAVHRRVVHGLLEGGWGGCAPGWIVVGRGDHWCMPGVRGRHSWRLMGSSVVHALIGGGRRGG